MENIYFFDPPENPVDIFGPTIEDVVAELEGFCIGCLSYKDEVNDEHLCPLCNAVVHFGEHVCDECMSGDCDLCPISEDFEQDDRHSQLTVLTPID